MIDILVVGSVNRETGGIAQYIDGQLKHLDEINPRTHDLAVPEGSGIASFLQGVLISILNCFRYIAEDPPDVVHVHTSHSLSFFRASFYVLFSRYVWRTPVVLHVHGSSFDDFVNTNYSLLEWYQGIVFGASCRVIALSTYWKGVLCNNMPESKIEIIPNAVDIDCFRYKKTNTDSTPHVVFISNLIERKGVNELAESIRRLESKNTPEYRITIAGKGPLSEKVDQLSKEFEHVEYRGFVSEAEKRAILESGTIYILPSYAEGLPIAILEGMASGNAIISTTVGSIPEAVTADNGITIAPKNVDELEKAIQDLIASPEKTAKMGRRSRQMCEEQYSWDHVIDRLQEVYEDCFEEATSL